MTKTKAVRLNLFALILTFLAGPSAWSSEEYSSYDDIIKDLKGAEVSAVNPGRPQSDLDAVKIHAGAGLINTYLNLDTPKGVASSATLRGVELFIGIDLFSREWSAEGAVRSYTSERFSGTEISLKEFDLKVIFRETFAKSLYWRAGAGVAARYLDLEQKPSQLEERTYTTPASVFVAGIGTQVNGSFSAGIDLSYKNSLINDTIDKSSVDGNFRLTGTF